MIKKENRNSIEEAISGIENKIKKFPDPYYEKILETFKQIHRELKEN